MFFFTRSCQVSKGVAGSGWERGVGEGAQYNNNNNNNNISFICMTIFGYSIGKALR